MAKHISGSWKLHQQMVGELADRLEQKYPHARVLVNVNWKQGVFEGEYDVWVYHPTRELAPGFWTKDYGVYYEMKTGSDRKNHGYDTSKGQFLRAYRAHPEMPMNCCLVRPHVEAGQRVFHFSRRMMIDEAGDKR